MDIDRKIIFLRWLVFIFGIQGCSTSGLSRAPASGNFIKSKIDTCRNWGAGVHPEFQDCVNGNFKKVSKGSPLKMSECWNPSEEDVRPDFTSCINKNFERLQTPLKVTFESCWTSGDITSSYEACINSNFSKAMTGKP